MSRAYGSGWSILGAVSRFRAPPRGMLFGSHGTPRPIETPLTEMQARSINARLTPVMTRLDQQRQAWFATTEQNLRLTVGGAALGGLVLGWVLMGNFLVGLALMVGGAFFALLMRLPQADDASRTQTKHAIAEVMADELLGLTSVAPEQRAAALPQAKIAAWRVLPPVRVITVDDRLIGERDGYHVALSRVGFQFGALSNAHFKQGDGLVFVIAEITAPDAPEEISDESITVILGTDTPALLQNAPRQSHGLPEGKTGDARFDARNKVFGDLSQVNADVRDGFETIEAVTRSDPSGTREVPAGTGLRPIVILRPGRLVVLTPVPVFDGALEPPPFWHPLDPDTLIPAFASDLAIFHDHLRVAMTLQGRIS